MCTVDKVSSNAAQHARASPLSLRTHVVSCMQPVLGPLSSATLLPTGLPAACHACCAWILVLLQMLIKGIRSFSPENTTPIEFYKPLTLIVGSNGAGKTVRWVHAPHGSCVAWLCCMAVMHGITWVQG